MEGMQMSTSKSLKQRIADREELVALRVAVTMDRGSVEKALESKKYDMLYVEGQHSPFTEDQLTNFCQMAEEIDIPVKLRIPHTHHTYLIGRYFDFGPVAIMVPEIEQEAQVEEAIKYTYYLPDGRRSFGGPSRYGLATGKAPEGLHVYAAWWNEQAVLGIMLESVEAISNARRFVKPGLDFIAFGTSDLGLSLATNPQFPIQDTDDCMRYVADQVKDQVALGMAIPTAPEERDKYREMGITIFQETLVSR
jgi:staphyloferrin B biosynthesis citrate synthase